MASCYGGSHRFPLFLLLMNLAAAVAASSSSSSRCTWLGGCFLVWPPVVWVPLFLLDLSVKVSCHGNVSLLQLLLIFSWLTFVLPPSSVFATLARLEATCNSSFVLKKESSFSCLFFLSFSLFHWFDFYHPTRTVVWRVRKGVIDLPSKPAAWPILPDLLIEPVKKVKLL